MTNKLSKISFILACIMLYQSFFPAIAFALTGGPSQPEVQSFEPVGTSEMVDLFSGDFNYNIPLLDVDGYPINLAYHSNVTMDQEASWVGLGWNINPGVINRNMRGIPDDFNGETISRINYVKPNVTVGINGALNFEALGTKIFNLGIGLGINYNNYTGLGIESSISPSVSIAKSFAKEGYSIERKLKFGIDFSTSNKDGLTIQPSASLSFDKKVGKNEENIAGSSVSMAINSRQGLKTLSFAQNVSALRNFSTSSANLSFGTQTYQPSINQAMQSSNFSFNFKSGPSVKATDPSISLSGFFAGQVIAEHNASRSAYGNLYGQNNTGGNSMLDYNREKDGTFSDKNPTLAIPVYTFDVYAASGQGVAGTFKAMRNDVPIVHDPFNANVSTGVNGGYEINKIPDFKVGANITHNFSSVTSGNWDDLGSNKILNSVGYKSTHNNDPFFEPAYFKSVGEKTMVNTNSLQFYELEQGAIGPKVDADYKTSDTHLKKADGSDVAINGKNGIKPERDRRNVFFSYRTNNEYSFCFNKRISYYPVNTTPPLLEAKTMPTTLLTIDRTIANAEGSKIGEISVTNPDGGKYVYSIPAINHVQHEVNFTLAKDKPCGGEISYQTEFNGIPLLTPNVEQIKGRGGKGIDHGYNVTKTPAYAHSYLLTDVLSSDYIDVSDDGVTEDDYGNYTHINYYKINNYKWRVPFKAHSAKFNPNLQSDINDNQASVIYGEKEIWLMAEVVGKNHVAKFYISPRDDGFGVNNEHGGLNESSPSYKLDKIVLYSKTDTYLANPIKTIAFEYDYTLCKNIDNGRTSGNGKLTLKKLYITYGNSTKGSLSPYEFNYSTTNPDYSLISYDRWGYYKPQGEFFDCDLTEYPYVTQNKNKADENASAWSLNQILLPSGGIINVTYESDDYAYVQNKQAMQMCKISGFGDYNGGLENSSTTYASQNIDNKLYEDKNKHKDVLFITLPSSYNTLSAEKIKTYLLHNQNNLLYFNAFIDLEKKNKPSQYEYVRGYAAVEKVGVINMGNGNTPVAWFKLKRKDEDQYNPIALSGWQFARLYKPELVYNGSNLTKDGDFGSYSMAFVKGLFGFVFDLAEQINGVYDKMSRQRFSHQINLNKSWVRINNLNGFKYGGGSRVKRLTISDNFSTMAGGQNQEYGQEYSYTTKANFCGEETEISSGVATYEPTIGNDENPWKMPISYEHEHIFVPNDEFYSEEPFGESFFPAPSIGYSRVTVTSINHEVVSTVNTQFHGTGKTVHLYHTAKDFPIFTSRTNIEMKSKNESTIFKLFGFNIDQKTTMAQGFQIELNDMHGKPAGTLNFDQANVNSTNDEDAFSGMKYYYNVEDELAVTKKLKSKFDVVTPGNVIIKDAAIGIDVDMVADSRQASSTSTSGGRSTNVDFMNLFLPIIIPMLFPSTATQKGAYNSTTMVRVVNRYGLLKQTEAFEEGASIKTENLLLDAETGETLLTRTYNEFKDPVYNFTMPAHWVYQGMEQAYKNAGIELKLKPDPNDEKAFMVVNPNGTGLVDPGQYLQDGDVLGVQTGHPTHPNIPFNNKLLTVIKQGSKWYLSYATARSAMRLNNNNEFKVKVINPARVNMQALPVYTATSLNNPLTTNGAATNLDLSSTGMLNASANEYADEWRIPMKFKNNCDRNERMIELVEITNFLLSTGQLTWTSLVKSIDETADVNNVFKYSLMKARFAELGQPLVYFKVQSSNILFGYQDGPGFIIKQIFNGILVDNEYNNDGSKVMADKIDYLGKVNETLDRFSIEYTKNNVKSTKVKEVNIELDTYEGSACNCTELYYTRLYPFKEGHKGKWRKKADWAFYGQRTAGNNIRTNGTYVGYSPFFSFTNSKWQPTTDSWTKTTEITQYHPQGYALEQKDAAGNFKAALYGMQRFNQVIAVADNAKNAQIAYSNAEEFNRNVYCPDKNLSFTSEWTLLATQPSDVGGHTGTKAFKLTAGENLVSNNNLTAAPSTVFLPEPGTFAYTPANTYTHFKPSAGKYVLSAWVYVKNRDARAFTLANNASGPKIKVSTSGSGGTPQPIYGNPTGKIINGWQKIDFVFTIPPNPTYLNIELISDATSSRVTYFDDIRIHPVNAKMKSYVYHPITQKLMAELDENNYATFYHYNSEGHLIRINKETEKGIVTIKEVRSNQFKKP